MGFAAHFVLGVLNSASIGIGAILGVLTRIGVNTLFGPTMAGITSQEDVLFNDLFSNILGCFVLGVFSTLHSVRQFSKPLALAISTGYAGSLTTFASWHLQVVQMLVAGRVLRGFLATLIGICMAASSFIIGTDFGGLLLYFLDKFRLANDAKSQVAAQTNSQRGNLGEHNPRMASQSFLLMSAIFTLTLFFALLAGVIAGIVLDRGNDSARQFWASASFAPVGAIVRWRLSFFNRFKPHFPIGTYVANMLAIAFGLALLTFKEIHGNLSNETSFFIRTLIAGLGGSLSTVSTWISESLRLPTAHRYFYVLCTSITGVLLGIISYGVSVWVDIR